jgi:hypothetical protein
MSSSAPDAASIPAAPAAPTRRARLTAAALVGAASGLVVALLFLYRPETTASDFDIVWLGARALLAHRDPFEIVRSVWPWPLHYPVPTLLAVAPFAPLPRAVARVLFAALTSGLLAYVVTRRAMWPLWMFGSGAFVHALRSVQWSPFLCAVALLPRARGFLVLKPSVGLALSARIRSVRDFLWLAAGSAAIVALGFLVWPGWLPHWVAAIRDSPHVIAPVMRPGGFLLLLALVRWRRADARMLAALALVPQTAWLYEALPLFLIPKRRREIVWLVEGSLVAMVIQAAISASLGDVPQPERLAWIWPPMFVLVYLPALVMVLVRPNVADDDEPTAAGTSSAPQPSGENTPASR